MPIIIENIFFHLGLAKALNKESFNHKEVHRDNLEDYRIHLSAATTLMAEEIKSLRERLDALEKK